MKKTDKVGYGILGGIMAAFVVFLIFAFHGNKKPEIKSAVQETRREDGHPSSRHVSHEGSPERKQSWLAGGNLHRATLGEWREASYANKLATAGDWLAAARSAHYSDLVALKRDAELLVRDVDEGANKGELASLKASEFAAGVLVIWEKQ